MDHEFGDYVQRPMLGEGQGETFLASIGQFFRHNLADLVEDLAPGTLAAEQSGPLRSSSCPRGVRPSSRNPKAAATSGFAAPSDGSWRWEDSPPPRRPTNGHDTRMPGASHSLQSSPDKGLLGAVVSGFSAVGLRATELLNTLDANFETMFQEAGRQTSEAQPAPAAMRETAIARPAVGVKGGRSSKGKLGASRIVPPQPNPSSAEHPDPTPTATSPSLMPARGQPLTSAAQACPVNRHDRASSTADASSSKQNDTSTGRVAAARTNMHRQDDAEAARDNSTKGLQLDRAEGTAGLWANAGSAAMPAAVLAPTGDGTAAAAAASAAGGQAGLAAGAAAREPQSAAEAAAGLPEPAEASRAALLADKRRRCIRLLVQEVAVLKQAKLDLTGQVERLAAENARLLQGAVPDPFADESVRAQLQVLLSDKCRLAEENRRLASENDALHQLLACTAEHAAALGGSTPSAPASAAGSPSPCQRRAVQSPPEAGAAQRGQESGPDDRGQESGPDDWGEGTGPDDWVQGAAAPGVQDQAGPFGHDNDCEGLRQYYDGLLSGTAPLRWDPETALASAASAWPSAVVTSNLMQHGEECIAAITLLPASSK